MEIVYFYVGNVITGEIVYREKIHEDCIPDVLERLAQNQEIGFLVWAIYNTAQSMEVWEVQFNNYMSSVYHEYRDDAA